MQSLKSQVFQQEIGTCVIERYKVVNLISVNFIYLAGFPTMLDSVDVNWKYMHCFGSEYSFHVFIARTATLAEILACFVRYFRVVFS